MRDRTVPEELRMNAVASARLLESARSVRLAHQQCLHLAAPVVLRARRGTLWITVDGDPLDVVLEAGESCRYETRGALLVYALSGAAELELQPLPRTTRPRLGARLARWWARATATTASAAAATSGGARA
jgi:hypothetical protein